MQDFAKGAGPHWEGVVWPFLDPWDVVGLRTTASVWNAPGKCGPHGELFFFFLIKKQPFVLTLAVEFRPRVTAETLKALCLDWFAHDRRRSFLVLRWLLAGAGRNSGAQWSKESFFGRTTKDSAEEASARRVKRCTSTTMSVALWKRLGRIGQARWRAPFLEDWELARVALGCHMALELFLPGNERCVPRKLSVTVFAVLTVFAAFPVFGRCGRFSHSGGGGL